MMSPGRVPDIAGGYLSVFLRYEGDFLKRAITPYIETDLGYTQRFGSNNYAYSSSFAPFKSYTRGAMGGLSLGVKFFTKRRVNFKLAPTFNWKLVNSSEEHYYTDMNGNYFTHQKRIRSFIGGLGLKFGIGF